MKKSHQSKRQPKKVKKEKIYGFLFCVMIVGYMAVPFFSSALDEHIEMQNQIEQNRVEIAQQICNYDGEIVTLAEEGETSKVKNDEIIETLSASAIVYSQKAKSSEQLEEELKQMEELTCDLNLAKLKQMKENPWTPTLDFLPYLQGNFEENVKLMAICIHMESKNASDEEQQLQGLVLLGRSFHPYSFSDGTGNLKSAILRPGQYPWAKNGIEHIVPNEQAYKNAEAVLTGNVLQTENIQGMTRNVEYANTSPLGYKTYCKIWNEPMQKWVYFDYGN